MVPGPLRWTHRISANARHGIPDRWKVRFRYLDPGKSKATAIYLQHVLWVPGANRANMLGSPGMHVSLTSRLNGPAAPYNSSLRESAGKVVFGLMGRRSVSASPCLFRMAMT